MTDTARPTFEDVAARPPLALRFRRSLFGNSGMMLGGGLLLLILIAALLGQIFWPISPFAQDVSARIVDPVWSPKGSWEHPLGTDTLGRDYLARLLYGARISLLIGVVSVVSAGLIGTILGMTAGYVGGRWDQFVLILITTRLAMPVVLIALSVVAAIGNSMSIVIAVLGLLLWDQFAVVSRSTTMQVKSQDYIVSAQALGCSHLRMLLREVLPNIWNSLVVVASIEMANAVLLEAALSFLGLGVQPPLPSWGLMVAEAKDYLFFSPWLITIPGIALMILVLGINLLGDGLRDLGSRSGRI